MRTTTDTLDQAAYEFGKRTLVRADDAGNAMLEANGDPITVDQTVLVFGVPGYAVQIPFDHEKLIEYVGKLVDTIVEETGNDEVRRAIIERLTGGIVIPGPGVVKRNGGAKR